MRAVVPPLGAVVAYAGNTSPDGWLECDGRALTRAEYPKLFQVIGTVFGEGDGRNTFNLPSLQPPAPGLHYIIRVGIENELGDIQ
jgi:microcystin-dependent protein